MDTNNEKQTQTFNIGFFVFSQNYKTPWPSTEEGGEGWRQTVSKLRQGGVFLPEVVRSTHERFITEL